MKKNDVFANVTNQSIETFRRENDNGTTSDMKDVLALGYEPSAVKVYSFKLASGTVSEKLVNLVYEHTAHDMFMNAYIQYWYTLELNAVNNEFKKYETAKDENKEVFALIEKRYNHAIECLNSRANSKGIPQTVKLLVYADRKANDSVFPEDIKRMFGPVKTALTAFDSIDSESPKKFSDAMKALRIALNDGFCASLWQADESETIIEKYRFNCNAKLADEVYRVAYEGRARNNNNGKIRQFFAKDSKIMREVVYACFMELQAK